MWPRSWQTDTRTRENRGHWSFRWRRCPDQCLDQNIGSPAANSVTTAKLDPSTVPEESIVDRKRKEAAEGHCGPLKVHGVLFSWSHNEHAQLRTELFFFCLSSPTTASPTFFFDATPPTSVYVIVGAMKSGSEHISRLRFQFTVFFTVKHFYLKNAEICNRKLILIINMLLNYNLDWNLVN